MPKILQMKSCKGSINLQALEDARRKGDSLCARNWQGGGRPLETSHFYIQAPPYKDKETRNKAKPQADVKPQMKS